MVTNTQVKHLLLKLLKNGVNCFQLKFSCMLGGQPRAVGKRTPRFPVSSLYRKDVRDNIVYLNKRSGKSEGEKDDDVAHEAALALAVASHKSSSPQVSGSPFNRTKRLKPSPVQSWERMVVICTWMFNLIISPSVLSVDWGLLVSFSCDLELTIWSN